MMRETELNADYVSAVTSAVTPDFFKKSEVLFNWTYLCSMLVLAVLLGTLRILIFDKTKCSRILICSPYMNVNGTLQKRGLARSSFFCSKFF